MELRAGDFYVPTEKELLKCIIEGETFIFKSDDSDEFMSINLGDKPFKALSEFIQSFGTFRDGSVTFKCLDNFKVLKTS